MVLSDCDLEQLDGMLGTVELSHVCKPWSGARVGGCRMYTCLGRPLVLGKNLNSWDQGKSSEVLVVFLAVIIQLGMNVEGRVIRVGMVGED